MENTETAGCNIVAGVIQGQPAQSIGVWEKKMGGEGIQACGEGSLVAVADAIQERADAFAEESGGAKAYYDFEEMLKDPDVDIVGVCTPSGLHADAVVASAQAKKHVLCEKPLDIKPERITRMVEACRSAGVKLGAILQSRTHADTIKAKKAIENGELGTMVLGDAFLKNYRDQAYYDSAGWRGTWDADGGGALMNQGIHGVDLLIWLMNDDVESVFARADHLLRDIEVEDTCVATLQFKGGAYGTIIGTTTCNPGEPSKTELHGKSGTICLSGTEITRWAVTNEEDGRAKDTFERKQIDAAGMVADAAKPAAGHDVLVADMVQAVKEDRDPYVTGESARKAVDLILAIYESARTGKEVSL
jgi:predicted dehydrogenase